MSRKKPVKITSVAKKKPVKMPQVPSPKSKPVETGKLENYRVVNERGQTVKPAKPQYVAKKPKSVLEEFRRKMEPFAPVKGKPPLKKDYKAPPPTAKEQLERFRDGKKRK